LITREEFFMIKEMYERGMSISDIAREGIDRKTARKYIHSPNPPSKSKRKPTRKTEGSKRSFRGILGEKIIGLDKKRNQHSIFCF